MEEMSIGKRIMALRKEKGLTQEQLAEKVNVSPQAVSKWENDISCPDIAIIPQLADVLGVTTDELLGVKPIEPHVVVVESKKDQSDQKKGFSFQYDTGIKGGIFFAIMLVLMGVAFLLSKTVFANSSVNFWGVCWPALLIILGLSWTFDRVSPISIGVLVFGIYYLLFNIGVITFAISWSIIWPVALILLGLNILCDNLIKRKKKRFGWNCAGDGSHQPRVDYSCDGGYVRCDSSFTEDNRAVAEDEFKGGDIDVSFGKGTLDLTACKAVAPGATLKIDVSFGSYEIILPRHIKAITNVDKAFGSFTTSGNPNENAENTLYISGDASFGTVNVRYL